MLKYQKEKITLVINQSFFIVYLHFCHQLFKRQNSVSVVLISLLITSCQSNEVAKSSDDSAYFPLRVGNSWIYNVEETAIVRTSCSDNGVTVSNYELQALVTDSFPATDQGFLYVIERAKRLKVTDPWQALDTWTVQRMGNRIISNQSSIKYVKLILPLANGLVWNGNLYNNQKELNGLNEDNYKATLKGQPYTNATGITFNQTVTIIQNEEQSNIIYRDSRVEVYAYQVGLVYKESYLLKYFSNSQLPCFGQKKTQQGITYKQTLKEFKR